MVIHKASAYGDDNRVDLLPTESADSQSRKERLNSAKARLKSEKDSVESEQPENNSSHSKPRGNKEKANVTDSDSRIIKARKGWIKGYNCQAVTDENQFIIATEVTWDCNDSQQLELMFGQVRENLEAARYEQFPNALSAEAGYWRGGLDIQEIKKWFRGHHLSMQGLETAKAGS